MKESHIRAIGALAAALAASLAFTGCSNITASSAAANRYAIVIGVSIYNIHSPEGTYPNLTYPDNDAEDLATLLSSKGWTVKPILIDSAAAYSTIEKDIADLKGIVDSNSTVLVYYSGHGTTDANGEACIIPADAVTANSSTDYKFDEAKFIPASTMSTWLGALSCKNKILILDSCYSGGFVDTGSSTDAIPSSYGTYEGGTEASLLATALGNFGTLLQNSISSRGDPDVLTITAAGSNEYSWDDGNNKHGAFTYYLLQAATAGDSDGDGYVTANEAYAYAKQKIKAVWNTESTNSSSLSYYCSYTEWYMQYYREENVHCSSWSDVAKYLGYVPDFMPHISGGTGDLVLYDNN
jgi:hypothetical protein